MILTIQIIINKPELKEKNKYKQLKIENTLMKKSRKP